MDEVRTIMNEHRDERDAPAPRAPAPDALDDVLVVLALLADVDQVLHPLHAFGDGGGYGVEPVVPPPLPPTGTRRGVPPAEASPRPAALSFDEWTRRGRGPAALEDLGASPRSGTERSARSEIPGDGSSSRPTAARWTDTRNRSEPEVDAPPQPLGVDAAHRLPAPSPKPMPRMPPDVRQQALRPEKGPDHHVAGRAPVDRLDATDLDAAHRLPAPSPKPMPRMPPDVRQQALRPEKGPDHYVAGRAPVDRLDATDLDAATPSAVRVPPPVRRDDAEPAEEVSHRSPPGPADRLPPPRSSVAPAEAARLRRDENHRPTRRDPLRERPSAPTERHGRRRRHMEPVRRRGPWSVEAVGASAASLDSGALQRDPVRLVAPRPLEARGSSAVGEPAPDLDVAMPWLAPMTCGVPEVVRHLLVHRRIVTINSSHVARVRRTIRTSFSDRELERWR
jgi:hypothetical protein